MGIPSFHGPIKKILWQSLKKGTTEQIRPKEQTGNFAGLFQKFKHTKKMTYSELKTTVINYYHTAKISNDCKSDRIFQVKKWLCEYHFSDICKFCPPYSIDSELPYSPKKVTNLILEILF